MGSIEKKFGQVIRRLRKQKGYTQEEFADSSGTERAYYGGIERGRHSPTLRKIEQLISALDIKWSTFFKYVDEK